MKKLSRILVLVAVLLLGVTFIAPLWKIEIWAPQYPEGLFMYIWTTKLTGDVRNINILNHYIGMKAISAADFPEFIYFPKAFAGLMIMGALVAAFGKKWLHYLWTVTILTFATWAFFDFWKWEYNFGHDLNPDAAIQMDGMTYSPPLLGHKELLNISAWSLPHFGGYGFTFAIMLAVFVTWYEFKNKTAQK
jgi:copper chaperone NosL